MKVLVIDLLTSTAYNCPKYIAEKTIFPSRVFTWALSLPKVMYSPFKLSLDTDIKLDLNPGVWSTLLKVIFLWTSLIFVRNSTFPFPVISKVDSFPAESPIGGLSRVLYDAKNDLFTKQWSLAPESIKVRVSDVLLFYVWNMIGSSPDQNLFSGTPPLSSSFSIVLFDL